MSASPQPRITPEQYLEFERAADFRHEYYEGVVYAMSGGSSSHSILIASVTAALYVALRKRPCTVTTADMRLRVTPNGLYTYPDVMVHCGAPQLADGRKDTLLNPTVIIEVLSPSTEAYDRGFKFHQYKLVESLQEYALVSQTEPRVEIFRRQPHGTWLIQDSLGVQAKCPFQSLDCEIDLADLYEKVIFEPTPIRPEPSEPR
jgi:Uma2 family endonuclease